MSNTKGRRYYEAIHARPLPLRTHPLPAFHPTNPLSFVRLAYSLLSERLTTTPNSTPSPSHPQILKAYYSPATRSVHVTDAESARRLWEDGFFGKGSLSRSEPEWLERERRRLEEVKRGKRGGTAGEVTERRREERREEKRERARREREELEERLRAEGKLIVGEVTSSESGKGGEKGAEGDVAAEVVVETIVDGHMIHQADGKVDLEHMNGSATRSDSRCEDKPQVKAKSTSNDARKDSLAQKTKKPRTSTDTQLVLQNQEHLQLTPQEAFYLTYGLGILEIHPQPSADGAATDPSRPGLSNHDLLELFRRTSTFPPLPNSAERTLPPDDPFLVNYLVFHHFRALGWVVRPGIKFAVDWLLYARGPVFAHAEFAVLVLPSYERWPSGERPDDDDYNATEGCKEHSVWRERGEWWWLHSANRVQNQVKKTLVLVYVSIPTEDEVARVEHDENGNIDIGALLSLYQVREFAIKRWSPNRNRD
ncbi:MAG: hypothetical protein M1831_002373 [Alyxoria varia]|nr:MAG: hypothetical protein M1831_002373 [Alyxoria varia]